MSPPSSQRKHCAFLAFNIFNITICSRKSNLTFVETANRFSSLDAFLPRLHEIWIKIFKVCCLNYAANSNLRANRWSFRFVWHFEPRKFVQANEFACNNANVSIKVEQNYNANFVTKSKQFCLVTCHHFFDASTTSRN